MVIPAETVVTAESIVKRRAGCAGVRQVEKASDTDAVRREGGKRFLSKLREMRGINAVIDLYTILQITNNNMFLLAIFLMRKLKNSVYLMNTGRPEKDIVDSERLSTRDPER